MWTVANVISFTTLWFMIIAILRSRRARGQLFNVYLIFSVLSDATKNILFFVCNLVNFYNFSSRACTIIGWYESFYIVANLWMGAVVSNELQGLLIDINRCKRISTNQEEKKKWRYMYLKSIAVHIFALCMASIMLETTIDWIPDISINTQCEALPDNGKESYYFWLVYVFLGMMIPTVYVIYVCCNIYKQGLLPTTGGTRALLFYFFRLLLMFFVLWIVFIVAVFLNGWPQAIAFVFINLAGFLSFCFAMTKPDISEAVIDMIFCKGQRLTAEEVFINKSITRRREISKHNTDNITSLHALVREGRILQEGDNGFTLHNNDDDGCNLRRKSAPSTEKIDLKTETK